MGDVVSLAERRAAREPRPEAPTAQDALDIATALIAAVKGGPNHVA